MQKKNLVLVGGGGHCRACIDVIEQESFYNIEGILDRSDLIGTNVLGYKVIGSDDDISRYAKHGYHFLVTVGQIKSASLRKQLFESIRLNGGILATVISPKANVSKFAQINKGTIVMHGVNINASAQIGRNCILNTCSIIEHDAIIGDHVHISTAAVINGGCKIGDEVFIGSNATISNHIEIGNNIVVGAGSVVSKSLGEAGSYVGNPVNKIYK